MSRVEFNLLPDLKMKVVKQQRTRSRVVSISILVSVISVGIFLLLLFSVYLLQNKQLSDADKAIKQYNSELSGVPNIAKILTVQNQLKSLAALHKSKHITSRIFVYLPQVTPTNVSIGSVALDTTNNIININGTASSQHAVNTFVDTLKFTTFTSASDSTKKSAFPNVIESSFSLGSPRVSYSLEVTYDPALFSNEGSTPVLNVPNLTTTRSVLEDPSNSLFNGQTGKDKKAEN